MKAWITKYALTDGVFEAEGEVRESGWFAYLRSPAHYHQSVSAANWCRTKEDALTRCEEMRIAKIASLKKQIAKLEKMEFKA